MFLLSINMIEDKFKEVIIIKEIQKKKADDLTKIVKKALPFTWVLSQTYDEHSYNFCNLEVGVGELAGGIMSAISFGTISLSGFTIEPKSDGAHIIGIVIYPHDQIENNFVSGYNMSKRFAKKFEKKYPGQYTIEIKPYSEKFLK